MDNCFETAQLSLSLIPIQKTVWDFVNAQIEVSTIRRVNWKALLGMTLTEYITSLKNTYDMNVEQCYNHIVGYLAKHNLDNADNVRRVKISVYARYGEQNSMKKRMELRI